MENIPKEVDTNSTWIVQEKIAGQQYCSYGFWFANNGNLLAHSVFKSEFTDGLGVTLTLTMLEQSTYDISWDGK